MSPDAANMLISEFLQLICERLQEVHRVAKAAGACALAGNPEKGIEVMLDIEQHVYEANILLNSASLINRLSKS